VPGRRWNLRPAQVKPAQGAGSATIAWEKSHAREKRISESRTPGVGRSATPELFFTDFPSENATGAVPAVLLAQTLQSVPHTSAGETK